MSRDQDEAAIRRAATMYATGADRNDKNLWAQVLTDDCIIEGPGFRAEGREVNLANLDYLHASYLRTQHRIHNQLYVIDGDHASGETYCTADHLRVSNGRTEIVSWAVRYQDELVRDGQNWRFRSRRLIVDWEEVRPVARAWDETGLAEVGTAVEDDRVSIAQTVYKYASAIDTRDWDLHRSIFADEVEMDFESWNEVPCHRIRADELKENVRIFFAGLDATQHSMSNPIVKVDGDRARCVVYMQAEHFLNDRQPSRRYVIGGYYTDDLVRVGADWKLTSVKLTVLWTEGDLSFMADAAERGLSRLKAA